MTNRAQQGVVILAFAAAAVSLVVVAVRVVRFGVIDATPLFGGLLMLVLALGGWARLKKTSGEKS